MNTRSGILFFAAICLIAVNGRAAPQKSAPPYASLPSSEISSFADGNLVLLLSPLPAASVIEKNPPHPVKGGKWKKKKKAANNNAANNADPSQGLVEVTDGDSLKVPMSVRTHAMTLETKLSTQAGTASPDEKAVYQQALALTTLFTDIIEARDAQITAIRGILKKEEMTDATSTGTIDTGHAVGTNNAAARQQTVIADNNDINDVETAWLKTSAAYQQQVNYQLDHLRALERTALMGPAAPAPQA